MSRRLPMPVPGFGEVLASRLGRRYAAGPDPADAVAVAARLRSDGLLVTCEYVAHPARTAADADVHAQRLAVLIDRVRETGLAQGGPTGVPTVDLLVPAGALGWGATGEGRLRQVCEAAARAGTWLTIRPGSVTDVDACLDLARRLREEFEDTGVEVWASLRRTPGDLTALLSPAPGSGEGPATGSTRAAPRVLLRTTGEGARVPGPVGLPTAMDIDRAFVRYAKRLLGGVARPVLAAPDATLVTIVQTLADRGGRADQPTGSQWLEVMIDMGRRGDEVAMLSALGRHVRVKVPFGPRWRAIGLRQLGARSPRLGMMSR